MNPRAGVQVMWPRPGKAIISLIAANILLFVLEALALRGGAGGFVKALFLSPQAVFEQGYVWQLVTYMFFHSPQEVGHLLFNMLWLWLFGAQMESWWGPKRLLVAYLVCGVSGGVLTLLVGLLSKTQLLVGLLGGFWSSQHLGASGAVMGIIVSWVIVHWNQKVNFLLLGEMRGKTFLWVVIGVELLVLISFERASSSAHFGGMAGAFVLCKGLWRPARWAELWKKGELQRRKKKLEAELRVIEGGKASKPSGKNGKNGTPLN